MQQKFHVKTTHPIALTSFDYLYPSGAIADNYKNPNFNKKLYKFDGAILDLGCAGGGFVKNCIDDGRIAIGLEGTPFNSNSKNFEWKTIPQYLFLCDITKPFTVCARGVEPFKFGVITAWEVLEHILKEDLPGVLINIKKHISPSGVFIATVNSTISQSRSDPKIDLHRTKMSAEWWTDLFSSHGFVRDKEAEKYFGGDWVRKVKGSFYFVFRLNK